MLTGYICITNRELNTVNDLMRMIFATEGEGGGGAGGGEGVRKSVRDPSSTTVEL